MEYPYAQTGGVVVSASKVLLEEKHRRASEFGRYIEKHYDSENPLMVELKRSTCLYRIAIANVLEDMKPKIVRKKKR